MHLLERKFQLYVVDCLCETSRQPIKNVIEAVLSQTGIVMHNNTMPTISLLLDFTEINIKLVFLNVSNMEFRLMAHTANVMTSCRVFVGKVKIIIL